jgi:hypothetical protein
VSIFKKLQDKIVPQSLAQNIPSYSIPTDIKHEFRDFTNSYRIGILCYYTDYDSQEVISNYKKELERLGYECEVLLFIDKKERENNIYLQSFTWDDLDRQMIPNSPRTDRFIVKRYDLLLNLFMKPSAQLHFIAGSSHAKCRVGLLDNELKEYADLLIPIEGEPSVEKLIKRINELLKIKPYERKQI